VSARGSLRAVLVLGLALGPVRTADAQPPVQPQRADARPAQRGSARALRDRFAVMLRERLELTDQQAVRLDAVSRRYMRERDDLVSREREVRMALRAQVAPGAAADQARTAGLLDEMLRLQAVRLQLVTREQRELATFLTPVQRARFIALQEQMQRAVQQARQRRTGAAGAPVRARPPAEPPRR
jgi:Spy/CpxP family protein refolding chaperone